MPPAESGQSPSTALARHGLRPRKRLGQNFLRDRRFLQRIVEAAEIGPQDEVLEIGAGTGVLTESVATKAGRVVAVELDDSLFELLQREFADVSRVRILHANALDVDPCDLFEGGYKLVGNIPYYITGPILRHFLEARCGPDVLVLMMQREVAQRVAATPGNLSLLGVSVQYYGRPEIVTRVPAGAFFPVPRVDSALVRIRPHALGPTPESDCFFQVARAGFGTRRKQLGNALAHGLGVPRATAHGLLRAAGVDESRRAESLELQEWHALAHVWCNYLETEGG